MHINEGRGGLRESMHDTPTLAPEEVKMKIVEGPIDRDDRIIGPKLRTCVITHCLIIQVLYLSSDVHTDRNYLPSNLY